MVHLFTIHSAINSIIIITSTLSCFSNQSVELALGAPTKCLGAVRADKSFSRFVAGSCSLHEPNQLTVLRFHPELNELGVDGTLDHSAGPVGVLCLCPSDKSLLLTVSEESHTATLWKIPSEVIDRTDELDYNPEPVEPSQDEDLQEHSLEQITTLVDLDAESPIVNMVWRDSDNDFDSGETGVAGEVLSLDRSGRVTMWDVEAAQPVRTEMVKFENQMTPPRLVWDPHSHRVAITVGSDVKIVDWRTDSPLVSTTAESFKAHRFGVADVDFQSQQAFCFSHSGAGWLD